jgi:hypothetical protein
MQLYLMFKKKFYICRINNHSKKLKFYSDETPKYCVQQTRMNIKWGFHQS